MDEIVIRTKEVRLVRIDDIKLNPQNPNIHPKEQLDQLEAMIRYSGFRHELVVSNQTGLLVAGHGRLIVARKLKMTHVPVSFQDFDDEAMEFAHSVADNAIQQQSILDFASINMQLPDFGPDFDPYLLGMKDFTIDVAEKLPEPPTNAVREIKEGDSNLATKIILFFEANEYMKVMRACQNLVQKRGYPDLSTLFSELVLRESENANAELEA
jgi:ParB-like nuclease domain